MRKERMLLAAVLVIIALTGCSAKKADGGGTNETGKSAAGETGQSSQAWEGTEIILSDEAVTVDGETASTQEEAAVYTGAEIVYYMEGQDETYGEGEEGEEHSAEEAAKHTVVTITQPGTYIVSGKLSYGQIAVDLGKGAKKDESAVVNLVLDNADITCSVAPAILVYKVYECAEDEVDKAQKDVDTTAAGFNLILADDSVNTITGSHVAKIYKEGTTAEEVAAGDAKKAHKYDAAIESNMSFNINAGTSGNGKLVVNADNEGIETKLHMTINGGDITVNANDDSLNAGEDSVSVITINDGVIICDSGYGDGKEGDGIDSNGWIVINGGYIIACANAKSMDSGVDSDMGVYINGGTLLATGHMYDEIAEESDQNFMVLSFAQEVKEGETVVLTDSDRNAVTAFFAVNDYSIAVFSSPKLEKGTYQLYKADSVEGNLKGSIYTDITGFTQTAALQYSTNSQAGRGPGGFGGGGHGMPPEGDSPDREGMELPEGERPDRADLRESEGADGGRPDKGRPEPETGEESQPSALFELTKELYWFGDITETE